MFPKLKLPNFPDYPSTPTCHLGRNTSNKITTMPAKKSCMMIRMAQVPPLSRTTPGRLVKPIEHLLKKMLSKPSPQIVKPLLQNSPHIYIPTIYGAFFFSSNTIMGPYLFHMGICCWQILGSLAMLVSTAFWSSENSVSKWPISRRLPYMPLMT